MTRRRNGARWLVAALTALLTGSFASGLVLCLGPDGHRALEFQHPGTSCPTLASDAAGTPAISATPIAQLLATCFDLPAVGSVDAALLSAEPERVPTTTLAVLAPIPSPALRVATRLAAPIPARAGPPSLARHLRSTVLLV
jgi:hypothetical protein